MFKLIKGGKQDEKKALPEPVPVSQQEWPNHDETWMEYMARRDYEGVHHAGPVTTVLCLLGAAVIVMLALLDALDTGLKGWV